MSNLTTNQDNSKCIDCLYYKHLIQTTYSIERDINDVQYYDIQYPKVYYFGCTNTKTNTYLIEIAFPNVIHSCMWFEKRNRLNPNEKPKKRYCTNCKFYHKYSSICTCVNSEYYRSAGKITSSKLVVRSLKGSTCSVHEFISDTVTKLPSRLLMLL